MNKCCPSCNQDFELEPGFYIGAMYVSYVLNVILMFVTLISLHYLTDVTSPFVYILAVSIVFALMMPFNFRMARSVYLHLVGGVSFIENHQKK